MQTLPPVLLLIGISALGPVVLNGVIPANSRIVQNLDSTYGAAQLVLTIYLLAIMVAQIVLGNWADRYGRRPVMIGSLLVFAAGGFICALAPSMEVLLLGRFIQGLGSSVCMILPRTIVRDVYERDEAASFIGYMTTAMMVAPLFGPAFGAPVLVAVWLASPSGAVSADAVNRFQQRDVYAKRHVSQHEHSARSFRQRFRFRRYGADVYRYCLYTGPEPFFTRHSDAVILADITVSASDSLWLLAGKTTNHYS